MELVPYAFVNNIIFCVLNTFTQKVGELFVAIHLYNHLRKLERDSAIIEFLENNHVARFFIFENKHRLRIFRPRTPVSGHGEGGDRFRHPSECQKGSLTSQSCQR